MTYSYHWPQIEISEVLRIASGQVSPLHPDYSRRPHIGPENIRQGGGIIKAGIRSASDLNLVSGKYVFDENSILYSKIRPALNKVGLPNFSGICSADMYPMWVRDPNKADREFIYHVLTSEAFVDGAVGRSFRTGIPKINREDLESLTIPLPPVSEQRKIAEILRTWDDAINSSEALVRAETEAFAALRRRLFLSDGHGVPLSEVSSRITTKSDGAAHTVMTISAKTGFVAQADKYRRDMAGASLANYTLLRRGEFAYNKGNSLTYPQGCIYALKAESALVPNVYYSFRLRQDLNSSYYEHFFASGALNRQLAQRISSGVRGNGLLNLNAEDFFGVKVPVPERATQDAAADALNTGARKIGLLQDKAELLRAQKRGLMQKLLTGRLRVNVTTETTPGETER
jgi:type I restriction enzyme, S subunit